ncbi:5'-3' exonuclease [Butyrivibrio sp. NC3005]|uniref:5'-3' exonuclease n=1 Tax=Butyrivibrio sp. NC3005 TaxID=1280685 RepID=UPI0004060349|nr:5'-3' exonuclease H3TH domain-containing protein [Butyrivibrio sp. NC3005]
MTDERLILIDGSSMLVTSYYGNLPRAILFEKDEEKKKLMYNQIMHNDQGEYTNAMFTMIKVIQKIIKEQKPTHMAFAFDKTRDTFRREKYADYKANRGETPDPLKEQFVNMENMLIKMGFPVFFDDNFEADDIVGSIAAKFEKDIPTYIITKDHDYLQLVNEYTRLWLVQTKNEAADEIIAKYSSKYGYDKREFTLPDKAIEVTEEVCINEYGVKPSQIPDLKGIQGDTSDNIPGVKGVSSAAFPLLKEYGTVENIYAAIDDCKDEKAQKELAKWWKEKLGISRSPIKAMITYRETALMSKDLATIRKNYPVDKSLDDFKIQINKDETINQFNRFGFKSLINKIDDLLVE